jgi:hypothetical protein
MLTFVSSTLSAGPAPFPPVTGFDTAKLYFTPQE